MYTDTMYSAIISR
jgi:hypothetical protein